MKTDRDKRGCGGFAGRFSSWILCLFLLAAGFAAHAGETRRTVRVGFGALPGYHEQTADGRRSGYGYDYLQMLASRAGWDCRYVGYDKSWLELQAMLERGEIDLLSNVNKTPEREQRFAFSANPVGVSFANITVRTDEVRFTPRVYSTWNGMQIGMVRGNRINERFAQWAKDAGFQYTTVVFETDKACHDALMTQKIDAMLSINFRRMDNEWLLERLFPDPVYFAVRKNAADLLAELNHAQTRLEFENPTLNSELVQRYYHQSFISFLQEKERRFVDDAARNGQVFRALLNPGRFPLAFFQNGKFQGSQYDVVGKILEHTHLKFQIVPCRDHAEYLRLRKAGDFDVILDAADSFSRAESEDLYLTDTYLTTPVSILVNKEQDGRTGKIALLSDPRWTDMLRDRGIDLKNAVRFDTIREMVEAVKSGKVDQAYLYTRTCNEFLSFDRTGRLASVFCPDLRVGYSMAVKRSAPRELLNVLNHAISAIPESEINDTIADYKFSGENRDFRLLDWIEDHPLKSVLMLLIMLAASVLTFGYILFARRKLYRNVKVLDRFPLRFFVADRNGRVLLAGAPGVKVAHKWKHIRDLDVPEVTGVMEKTVAEAFRTGSSRIDYDYENGKRSAAVSLLPESVFGVETAIWVSQDTTEL